MGRCLGRARAHAAAALLMFGAVCWRPTLVSAQDEEIIADPELSGSGKKGASNASSDDEVIADPELSGGGKSSGGEHDYGWGTVYKPKGAEEPESGVQVAPEEPDPTANTGIAKLEISGQTAIDTHAEENLEDFYEARLRFGGEVDFRISRRLRLSIGTRLDFAWYAPFQGDDDLTQDYTDPETMQTTRVHHTALQEDRYELDIIPLSAYIDATIADGVHLRIGEQVISLARMDGISVTDMLAVVDFRPQTKNDPSGLKLAQPAVRLDWDFNSWSTLQLVYVPWFMPHLMRPNRDNYVGRAVTSGGSEGVPPTVVSRLINPSYQTLAQQEVLRFVGPAPDFSHPQAEARMNFRGSSFEVALLGGTALEKIPAVYYTPLANSILLGPGNTSEQRSAYYDDLQRAAGLVAEGATLTDFAYHRYYMAGIDGSFDISPIQIGFEFSYSPSRHLYTSDMTGYSLPIPDTSKQIADEDDAGWNDPTIAPRLGHVTDPNIRKGAQMVQAALHVEYLKGESLLLAAEGYLFQALELPHSKTRQWLGFPVDKGTFLAGLVTASYNIQEGKYRFDATFFATTGPSFIITPQIEFQVVETFYLNIGAQFYEGPTPNNLNQPRRVATNLTLGGVLSGYDNVYLGFRWSP
jgi:hypothetical protein